jgi:P pilus assembly chaperone PapD
MSKHTLLFSILLFANLLCAPEPAKAEFLYEPVVVSINAPSGRGSTVVQFSNPFKKPARIQLSLSEWDHAQGNKPVKKTKDVPQSIVPFVKVSPLQFTLEPGKQKKVRIATAIPADYAKKEYNLFLEILEIGADRKSMDGPAENQTLNLNINRQTNAGLYIRKDAKTCELQIPEVSVKRQDLTLEEKDKDGKNINVVKTALKYKVTYTNTGDVHTRKDIGIRVVDSAGGLVFEKKYTDTLIAFPTASTGPITIEKQFYLPEKLDPKGEYEVEFGFTRSPDQIKGSTCDEQAVKAARVRLLR